MAPKPNEPRGLEAIAAVNEVLASIMTAHFFEGRGFSDSTIHALVAFGIDRPERLLSMDKRDLAAIPRVGRVSMSEIMRYRERFSSTADHK